MEINRRKFHRIPSQGEPCTVKVDNLTLSGSIIDESISGAKVADLDLLMMPYNKQVTLEYREGKIDFRAMNVERTENGYFKMGVVRSELSEEPEGSNAMLVNCYVQHQEAYVICMPIHIESDNQVLIQLWDGVQFRVPRSKLFALSRSERFELLANDHILAYTAVMYGFQLVSPEVSRRQIFEHEYGTFDNCQLAVAGE
jgi:hypothetical protein